MTPLKPMLAKDPEWSRVRFPLIVQPKLDGIRCHVQGGIALSRTLKRIPNLAIQAALGRPEFEGLDGEIIVGLPTAADCYRRTSSFVMAPDKTGEPWCFYVFDKIDSPEPYTVRAHEARLALLNAEGCGRDVSRCAFVAGVTVDDAGELEAVEAELIDQGYEGAIARMPTAAYKHGRSTPAGPLLKIKRFIDFEAEVIGVYEEQHNSNERFTNELGRGARSSAQAGKIGKGTLGGLVVRALNGPAAGVEFRVGTGFDADDRRDLWQESVPGPYPGAKQGHGLDGRVAKVKSFPIGVKDKPRHPVFLGWRDLGVDG